ncbi:phosphatidate cytidylyltransferase [Lactobacillus selangorensis]|uniref:Phosphatidate cytidylyltransferase n=1 Tax=Lactobacillus selangorensis TaxID=81857 RepID=A0A0R2GAN8_9LACO|nr:phosphatidate cytidylyltransferase [Lactobacillus selangorensis]KRN29610.1 phosphatidate cytidylyltransferase [Lactobacillus selangorensis]KRN33860.1 phosphatidate cytidylyltransferase [Lactobacillus selangorensis]
MQRIITAVVLMAIMIPLMLFGGIWLDIAACILGVIGVSEIFIMRKRVIMSWDFVITTLATLTLIVPRSFFNGMPFHLGAFDVFYFLIMILLAMMVFSKNHFNFDDAGVLTLAALYIGTGFHNFAAARNLGSAWMIFWIVLIITSTDTGAYEIGKRIGKHKLWPVISPNKTWEGSIGGTVVAVIISAIYLKVAPAGTFPHPYWAMLILSFIFSCVGQLGDLVESAYKRYYGVKDSGKILPGHGGILDRFDSVLFTLPLLHLFGLF